MLVVSEATLLITLVVVQVVGLLSLVCARLKCRAILNHCFRVGFLVSLLAVGFATMCAVGCASDWWVSCSTTLALMAVGGTIDCGRSVPSPAF